jgi:hypothetical protein
LLHHLQQQALPTIAGCCALLPSTVMSIHGIRRAADPAQYWASS